MANPVNFQGNTVDDAGNVIAQAQITVTGVVSGLLPQLYSDVDLQNNITNPFNSNNDGSFEFYLENEQCNVKAEKDGFTREWKNLFLKKEGAWALEDGSNDSDFVTGYYTTPRGWNSRWSHKLTLESSWTGNQNYNDLTVTHTNVIINADSASTLNFEGDSVFGNATPPTNNPAVGDTLFNGQAGFNSTIAIADLSDQTAYKTMENINGDLQWGGQKFTGTAASKNLTSPSATIWDDGNLNTNIFNCNGSGKIICKQGYASSSSTAVFILNIFNVNLDPTSIIVTSTFQVRDAIANNLGTVGTSDISLSSSSSPRSAVLVISNISGATTGEVLTLRSVDSNSQIEVI